MWQDAVNGLYGLLAGVMLWNNVRILIKQKEVKGVSIATAVFFTLCGCWYLYYYPHLNQWLSFFSAFVPVSANITWMIFAIYYTRRKRNEW